ETRMGQTIYTSATPGPYEREISEKIVQQVIRPTGVLDPEVSVRPIEGQIDDLLQEIAKRVKNGPDTSTRWASERNIYMPKSKRWNASKFCVICGWVCMTCWSELICCAKA